MQLHGSNNAFTAVIEPLEERLSATGGGGVQWQPNPGPQTTAYESKADVLGYGGAAGGGKSALLLGLAGTQHKRSVIFRRVFPNLRGIIEDSREVLNPDRTERAKDSYNETLHRWSLDDGRRMIEFEACQHEKDKEKQRGRPRDFYGFDEATEFTRSQFEFITAWNRSTEPGQRCRVVLTFNPPSDDAGGWVIDYFLPWLAYLHPEQFQHDNPAAPGELRWYATLDGDEMECESGRPFEHNGETITPRSRTFIPAKLEDNPYLIDSGYRSVLQSLPEPFRSQLLYGDFSAQAAADPYQVVPAAWVKLAQKRWLEREKPNMPLSGVGVDLVRGGKDAFALSRRYGTWFDEIIKVPGVKVEDGPAAALLVHQALENEKHIGYINVDVVGVGSSGYDSLKAMPAYADIVQAVSAGSSSSYIVYTKGDDPQPLFSMFNLRAEYHWKMREALDPEHGNDMALPPGNELLADLCAAKYKLLAGSKTTPPKIQIEKKDDIKDRIGRSPDEGEAVMMANLEFEQGSTWEDLQDLGTVENYKSRWG